MTNCFDRPPPYTLELDVELGLSLKTTVIPKPSQPKPLGTHSNSTWASSDSGKGPARPVMGHVFQQVLQNLYMTRISSYMLTPPF